MASPVMIPFNPILPWEGDVKSFMPFGPMLWPMEYNGWREEVQSWKNGAYLGTAISHAPTFVVKGPDAERFFSDHFVNNFATMPVGGFRHGIMCDEKGRIMQDGVVLRIALMSSTPCGSTRTSGTSSPRVATTPWARR